MFNQQVEFTPQDDPFSLLKRLRRKYHVPTDIYDALICVYKISRHQDPLVNWQKMTNNMLVFGKKLFFSKILFRYKAVPSYKEPRKYKCYMKQFSHISPFEISKNWNLDPKLSGIVRSIISSWIYKEPHFFFESDDFHRKRKHLKKINKINKKKCLKDTKKIAVSSNKKEPTYWCPFKGLYSEPYVKSPASENNNFFILGEKGSGKTQLCKEVVKSVLAEGGKVLVIDDGSDYKELCDPYGNYITGENLSHLSINLFSFLSEGDFEDIGEVFETLTTYLMLMAFDYQESFENDRHYFQEALHTVWGEKGQKGHLIDIIDFLESHDSNTAHKIASNLSNFYAAYGGIFKEYNDSTFQANLTVVNFKDLDNPLMQTMVTSLLMSVFRHQKNEGCAKPFLILVEDTMLPDPSPPFADILSYFLIEARQKRISIGRVSSQIEMIAEKGKVHYSSLFDMAYWRTSCWKIFFNGGRRYDILSARNPGCFSEKDLYLLNSLSDQSYIAMVGPKRPLKEYTLNYNGETYDSAA